MSWASEMSDLCNTLWKMGQERQRMAAVHEGLALRHDLTQFCLECNHCLNYFNARWPHLRMNPEFVEAMWRN